MEHIKVVEKAIKFEKADYIPMELVDVPHIYNAYGTLNPEKVEFIPGTENFIEQIVSGAKPHITLEESRKAIEISLNISKILKNDT